MKESDSRIVILQRMMLDAIENHQADLAYHFAVNMVQEIKSECISLTLIVAKQHNNKSKRNKAA